MVRFYRLTTYYLCNELFSDVLDIFVIKMVGFILRKFYKFLSKSSKRFRIGRRIAFPPVTIQTVSTHQEWKDVHTQLMAQCETIPVLGLDAEWIYRFGRRYPVSLLQLAGKGGLCVLIQMNLLPKPYPASFRSLMGDPSILKVGVGICVDVDNLRVDHDLHIRGYLDLRNVLPYIPVQYHCPSYSLKNMAQAIINFDLKKDKFITTSNWEEEVLTQEQLEYAALDALVGVIIFLQLMLSKLQYMDRPFSMIHKYTDADITRTLKSLVPGIVQAKPKGMQKKGKTAPLEVPKRNPSLRAHSLRAYSLRRNSLYDNCQLLAPDNQLLCTCDTRKAKWYLSKGLGDVVCENPLVIRLKFEPSGRPSDEDGYYQQEKDNVCVVCGKPENYLRKNVIPHEYRTHFPSAMKDHASHDIVLMCPVCHQRASKVDAILRENLARFCNAPLAEGVVSKTVIDVDLAKIRSAAKALMQRSHVLPDARREELVRFLMSSLGVTELTDQVLQKAIAVKVKIVNPDYSPHGQKVVEHMKKHKKLLQFQYLWRKHFLETMEPRFLPSKWSIDHNHEFLSGLLKESVPSESFDLNVLTLTPKQLEGIPSVNTSLAEATRADETEVPSVNEPTDLQTSTVSMPAAISLADIVLSKLRWKRKKQNK
ncbi:exonuclease 3'-5' domain-containing protein 2-like isoform X1 [Argonauta hians]